MAALLPLPPRHRDTGRLGTAPPSGARQARRVVRLGAALIGLASLIGWQAGAQAQQVYRIVGPDGRVTFSDRPPEKANAAPTSLRGGAAADANSALPPELRKTASQYPVTLYVTRSDCSACDAGRRLLQGRGIPYTEKTVDSAADNEAFKRITGGDSLPALGIGNQTLKGLLDTEWNSYLDAAGYPRQIQLPASYRQAPATPLVPPAPSTPAKDKPAATKPNPPLPVVPQRATENNPAGLQF